MSAVTLARSPSRIQADYFSLVSDGKIERAQQFIDAALAEWPEDPNVLSSALLHASRVGEFDQAMNFARQLEDLARKTGDETLLVNYFWLVTAVLLQQNKLQEAKDILRKIPEQLASNLLIQFSKAYLLRLEWRLDEADRMMARIYRSIEPKNPFVQLQWGWTQQHAGRYEEALATFRALKNSAVPGAEDLYPDAEALYCETLTFMGEWDEALERLSELRSKYPFNVLTLQVTAMVMLRRHRYSEVLDVADKIMSLFLGDTAAFQLKAAALTRLGRLHEAQQIIAEGLQISPLSAGLRVYRGWVNFALHDLDTAEEDFSAIASKSPRDPTSHTGLAAVAFQRRDYQEAFDLFTKVAKISVIDPGTQANLALTLAAMGDDEASAKHYEIALKRDPGNVQALTCKSGVAFRHNESGRARTLALEASYCDPKDLSCQLTLAAIDSARGDYESARKLIGHVIGLNPLFAQAHLELGILDRKQGNGSQARLCLRRALEIDSEMAAGYRELADLELQDGRLHQAEAILREGIDRMKPREASLYARLGHVMRLLGEQTSSSDCYDDASAQLATALRLGPDDNFFAEFELGIVQIRQGAYSHAKRTFEHILQLDPTEPHAKVMLTRVSVLAKEPRQTRWWALTLAVFAVAQSAIIWTVFLLSKVSATTFSALLSLFAGLLLVAALLPKLTKVTLGGLQAELTTVTYRPEMPTVTGPTPRPQMTTSAMVGTAFWFWP